MVASQSYVRWFLLAGGLAGVLWLRHHIERADMTLEQRIVLHTKRGISALEQSCPVKTSAGLCRAAITRNHAASSMPERCGPLGVDQVLVTRTEAATRAVAELRTAVALYERVAGKTGGNEAAARRAFVEAKLAIADVELERYLAMPFPASLNFDPSLAVSSKQQLAAWLARKQQAAERLRHEYRAIAAVGDTIGALAAAVRVAQIAQATSDTLLSSPIPAAVRTNDHAWDSIDAYCDVVTLTSEPFEQQAVEAFTTCAQVAAREGLLETNLDELRGIARWSQLCASELADRSPDEFPALEEALASDDVWLRIRYQLMFGNYQRAHDLLVAMPPSYDQLNMLGVALRGERKLGEAQAAYLRAISVAPARPEAYYNAGVLFADHIATTVDVPEAILAYRKAIAFFDQSAARATGAFARDVAEKLARARNTVDELQRSTAD